MSGILTIFVLGQIYMPEARHCTMVFLRKLMNGEKKFFYTKDVHMVNVPRFASISVKYVLA